MSDTAATSDRRALRWYLQRTWLRVALLCLCGFAARFPAIRGELIWDDDYLIRANPLFKSPILILETFRHYLFIDSSSTHYRPIQNISYCLDYLLWRGELYGYHVANVAWHVGSGVLLFFLARRLLCAFRSHAGESNGNAAFVVALLWLVHPVHSAAIDYISGRADSLAAFFACAAWLLYLRAKSADPIPSRVALSSAAAVAALVALASRETGLIWMLIFILHALFFEKGSSRAAKALVVSGCLAVIAGYIALRHLPSGRAQHSFVSQEPLVSRLVLMLRALGDYARLLFWPTSLHMDRTVESPTELLGNAGWRFGAATEYLSVLGLAGTIALFIGARRAGENRSLRAFGVLWFVIGFLPISNIMQLNATVAEHWLYLPSVGLFLFLVGCGLESRASLRKIFPTLICVAAVALGARSFIRSGDWLNPETFYRRSLAAGASRARIALNLGLILTAKGDYATAEPLLRRVVNLEPDYPFAVDALAHLLLREGKHDEAQALFDRNTKIAEQTKNEYPRTWNAALSLAGLYKREKNLERALQVAQKARAEYPATWEVIAMEAELLRETRGAAAAIPAVEQFARQNWWHAGAAVALGKLHSQTGDYAAAEASFRNAARLDIYSVEALNLIALQNVRINRLEHACTTQREAIARQPDQPRQYLLLSDILEKMGRADEARAALAQVAQLTSLAHGHGRLN